jgi:hypothetical protein
VIITHVFGIQAMTNKFGFSKLAVLAAGVSLLATPVAALDLPTNGRAEIVTGVTDQAGWGDRRRHRGGGGIDTGDVLAGVLVIGAIAAIAGAADNNSRNDDRRRQARYPEPQYRPDPRANYQSSRGLDSAVSMCVDQVERGSERVRSVDNAGRTSDGWRISGALDDGAGWNCWIDNDGRIREVNLSGETAGYSYSGDDGRYSTATASDGQLSDDVYARARAAQRSTVAPESSAQPAYPGGPLPGEEGYDEAVQFSSVR